MASLVNVPLFIVSVVSQLFQSRLIGILTGFPCPNFQAYDCLDEKDSVWRRLFFKLLFSGPCSVKQIVRIGLLWKFYLVCFDVNNSYGFG